MFSKILIANRGEIAVRIIRTCKRLGVRVVAVHSEADARAPYVGLADEAIFIGGARAADSYLDQEKILSAARKTGCEAIHPGYGFLSENAGFASAVARAGLSFIGPTPEAVALLGDKIASKALALRAGVPVVPGHAEPLATAEEAAAVAEGLGYPVLLKPAAGGGGRGMRIVRSGDELAPALAACRDETRKSFADDRIFVERYIAEPRHIEVQILSDRFGNVIHLGERECSIQRRYQKVIEETPSTVVGEELRAQMGSLAVALAKEAGYTNAGTVEFILDTDRSFYFLEMNTRLQVEHPITELVTGLDLVELQLRIAAGEPLPLRQEDVRLRGWAIEARICAEDPARGFLPTTGLVTRYSESRGPNVRIDSGIETGTAVTVHYDSLLAKVAAWGETREEARQTLVWALNGYHVEGVVTNTDFANALIGHPAFVRGELSTSFIERHFGAGALDRPAGRDVLHPMVMAATLVYLNRQSLVRESLRPLCPQVGCNPGVPESRSFVVRAGDEVLRVELRGERASRRWQVSIDGEPHQVVTPEFEFYRRRLRLQIDGVSHMFRLQYDGSHIRAHFCGLVRTFEIYTPREWELGRYMLQGAKEIHENVLRCPMPGLITTVLVRPGAEVQRGQELVRMESMKMESGIASPCDGRVEKILVEAGSVVEADDVLITFG